MATREGAKAVRMEDRIGSIETGKLADIVLIDATQPHLNPLFDPYTQIVHSSRGSDVDTVIVGGEIKVLNKEVLPLCRDEIMEIAERWKKRITES